MANDNVASGKAVENIDVKAGKTPFERGELFNKKLARDNADEKNWEWVTIPAQDLFGQPHNGISINFTKYGPEVGEDGNPTGQDGRHYVNPEIAKEIHRLLKNYLKSDMRVLQPNQDPFIQSFQNKGALRGASTNMSAVDQLVAGQ